MTTVNWIVDTDGRYEVRSPEHLIQIMHKGEKYTNTGDAPTNYLQEATKYIQTVDIDLKNYHSDIVPIGGDTAFFLATYDGGGHSIANWELHDESYRRQYSGMFGRIDNNGTVKNLRLTGVWKNTGEATNKTFLAGYLNKETCSVYDIKTDFEIGTVLSGAYNSFVGVLVGSSQGHISGCVVQGFIKFSGHAQVLGGICGTLDRYGSITYCFNYGNFVGGLGANNSVYDSTVGGIVGRCHYGFRNIHHVVNGMVGDLVGGDVGGILSVYSYSSVPPERADTWLNCMVGDIIGTNRFGYVGGMFGTVNEWNNKELPSLSKMVNYMSGSILRQENSPYLTGAIVGRVKNSSQTFNLSNSVVAMSGFVQDTAIGQVSEEDKNNAGVTVNTDFGLTFDSNTFATTDPLTDFVTDDTFTLLPYLDMSGTTEFGTAVEFSPIFANLSGLDASSPYSQYTTLTIHTSPEISFPVKTSFTFDETNTTKYFTYAKRGAVSVDLYVDDGITVESSGADSVYTHSGAFVSGLDWTQDEFGSYEISSFRHLIQLMTKGTVYADTGAFPPDYRAGSYTPTADIDIGGYKAVIVPIGQKDDPFVGDYIGGGFTISDWSYERGIVEDGTDVRLGFFGEVQGNISHLKLRATWSLGWSNCSQAGFLVGRVSGSTSTILDIDASFDEGTIIQPDTSNGSVTNTCGVLIGETEGISTGIHLSGSITFEGRSMILGGVVGEISNGASISWIKNDATFNKTHAGLGAGNHVNTSVNDVLVGGIVGSIGPNTDSAFHLLNAMIGDIQGEFCGGIVGRCSTHAMTRSDTWVNCMQGNLTGPAGSTTGCSGGIIGDVSATGAQTPVITKAVNYMHGNIATDISGGIIGRTTDASGGAAPAVQCNNSAIAMNGIVSDTAIGQAGHPVALSISVNTYFGLVFTTNSHASDDALTGYVTNPELPLPYLEMKGGELGVANDFEIIFVNLGGVVETSPLFGNKFVVIHTSPVVTFPYKTEFDFPDTNTTAYLTYGKLGSPTLYIDPSLTVVSTEALHVLDYAGNLLIGVYPPINVNVLGSVSSQRKQFHSFTAYTKTKAICTGSQYGIANSTSPRELDGETLTGVSWERLYSRGMHFNPVTDKVYYINGPTGKFRAFGVENYTGVVDVSTDETYHTLNGDFSNLYIFGSKTSTGGVKQVFRTDADGTNEIVVDTSTLFDGNAYGTSGFAVDRDNQKVYFHDTTHYIVRSLSWELTGLVNMQTIDGDLTVYGQNAGSLCYAQGFLYFGGRDPQTKEVNYKFYQYDLKDGGTREMAGVTDHMRHSSQGPTNDLYIDPFQNVMVITGYAQTWEVEGGDFDFYKAYCSVTTRYHDGYDVTWEAIQGATSYEVVVNDIVVGTTTDLTFTTRGYADGIFLNISIKYSTDDVTYADVPYMYTNAATIAKFSELQSPSNFQKLLEGSATWLDPYNPSDIIYAIYGGICIYNFSADTITSFPNYGMHMLKRSFATKGVIGLADNKLTDLGENAQRLVQATVPDEFYTHPQSIQHFHCSYDGLIYFTVKTSNEVWTVKVDGTDAQLLFTLNSTATSLATDPHDPTTLVYGDGDDLMYRNLSTGVSRVVLAGASMFMNNGIVVLDDMIYTTYRWQNQGYLRVNIDGVTGLEQGERTWGYGTLVDTVNQKVYQLDIENYTVYVDANFPIASLPPDPSSVIVTTNPLGLLVQWGTIPGAVQYRVGTSVGNDGDSAITIRHTTVDGLRYRHTTEPETTHTVYLYYDTSNASDLLHYSTTVLIPPISNTSEDFDKDFFASGTGSDEYDLTPVSGDFGIVLNELFESGDKLNMSLANGKQIKTQFVQRGGTVRLNTDESISVPFSKDAGAGQTVSLTLSDDTTVAIEFDETTEFMTIDGVAYTSGDTFIIDGQKVTIVDV